MKTKRMLRAGRCGFRRSELERCRKMSRTYVMLTPNGAFSNAAGLSYSSEKWQCRCAAHQKERYL